MPLHRRFGLTETKLAVEPAAEAYTLNRRWEWGPGLVVPQCPPVALRLGTRPGNLLANSRRCAEVCDRRQHGGCIKSSVDVGMRRL